MKIFCIIFFASLFLNCASTTRDNDASKREFEGIIAYKIKLESKTHRIPSAHMQNKYGDTMVMLFKNGMYKMSFTGSDIKNIFYFPEDNIEYMVFYNIDTLFVSSCDYEPRPLLSFKESAEEEIILGRKCNKMVGTLGESKDGEWGAAINSYWYDPEIYLNPNHYKDRKISYSNLYYGKAKSPWLKGKYELSTFDITYTAIRLEEKTINDSLFQLPDFPGKIYP